jgi:NIMA-interacting peptidyl-prolyl cis-trans isomerase 1
MMPGKSWAYCMGLVVSTLSCAAKKPPPPETAAHTVVVNLAGTARESDSSEARPPALGAATAPVTIVALVAFSDAESAALYQALRRLQARLGEDELRLVLVTPETGDAAEVMADTLQQNHGDAAYFDFASRMFADGPAAFGDALRLALDVSVEHARDPRKGDSGGSEPILRSEADALFEHADPVIPALSVNGIRVFGRLPPSKLEALVLAEHEAARALGRKGVAARAVYPERVASNADRIVRREAEASKPRAPALQPSAVAPENEPERAPAEPPERVTASHILFSYQGASRARPEVSRSKAEAKALAEKVLGRLRRGALTFEDAVARYSDDAGSAERKGALGSFGRAAMVKPFAQAAFALQPDQLSDVIETDFGFHIIWRQE